MSDTIAPQRKDPLEPTEFRSSLWAGIVVNFILLCLIITYASKGVFYDEPWYISTVGLLKQHGLTLEFLRSLPGPAGPLYTLVHAALSPLTGVTTPGIRFVNVIMLLGTVIALYRIFGLEKTLHPLASALSITAAPMIWVVTGIALTEMAATFFSSVALCCLWHMLRSPLTGKTLVIAILGGLCLGLGILGRQPLLVFLVPLPLFAIYDFRMSSRIVVFGIASIFFPAIAFFAWQGLVPPRTAFVEAGLAPAHGLLALTYAGIVMLVWAPDWFRMKYRQIFCIVLCTCAINAVIGLGSHEALRSLAIRVVSPHLMPLYGRLVWGAMASVGLLFFYAQIQHTWAKRYDPRFVFLSVVVIMLLMSSMKITHLFSSRYVVAALPMLLIMSESYTVTNGRKAFRLLLGGSVGAISLLGYYKT